MIVFSPVVESFDPLELIAWKRSTVGSSSCTSSDHAGDVRLRDKDRGTLTMLRRFLQGNAFLEWAKPELAWTRTQRVGRLGPDPDQIQTNLPEFSARRGNGRDPRGTPA